MTAPCCSGCGAPLVRIGYDDAGDAVYALCRVCPAPYHGHPEPRAPAVVPPRPRRTADVEIPL